MGRHFLALAFALAALIGCARPVAAPAESMQQSAAAVAAPITRVAIATVQALPLPAPVPPPPAAEPCANDRSIELIIAFEVGSPEVYARKYTRPIWPGAASGATWGLGYDGGHRTAAVIARDWETHPHHVRLQSAAGITGPLARNVVRELADVSVDYGLARQVFDQTSLVEHCHIARRVFRPAQFDAAHANTRGALTSLVFNRGGSMAGPGRVEMRAIRDDCLPRHDAACTAQQIRAMVRLWVGSDIEQGMRRRRYAEATLAEST